MSRYRSQTVSLIPQGIMSKNVDASQRAEIRRNIFPSPLLHTGERVQHSDQSFTTTSHRRKSHDWVSRYGKPHNI